MDKEIVVEVRLSTEEDMEDVEMEKEVRDFISKNLPDLSEKKGWREADVDFDDGECRIMFEKDK